MAARGDLNDKAVEADYKKAYQVSANGLSSFATTTNDLSAAARLLPREHVSEAVVNMNAELIGSEIPQHIFCRSKNETLNIWILRHISKNLYSCDPVYIKTPIVKIASSHDQGLVPGKITATSDFVVKSLAKKTDRRQSFRQEKAIIRNAALKSPHRA